MTISIGCRGAVTGHGEAVSDVQHGKKIWPAAGPDAGQVVPNATVGHAANTLATSNRRMTGGESKMARDASWRKSRNDRAFTEVMTSLVWRVFGDGFGNRQAAKADRYVRHDTWYCCQAPRARPLRCRAGWTELQTVAIGSGSPGAGDRAREDRRKRLAARRNYLTEHDL